MLTATIQRVSDQLGNTIKGHWEIHPVEKVISIDNGLKIQIGPAAKYVKPVGSIESCIRFNEIREEMS